MGYTNYCKPCKPEENEWVPKELPKELQDDICKLAKTAKAMGIEFIMKIDMTNYLSDNQGGNHGIH